MLHSGMATFYKVYVDLKAVGQHFVNNFNSEIAKHYIKTIAIVLFHD